MNSGFLNLYKPKGWTSHDCVARVRRLLHTKKVGHGGTLDPAAVGVLPIAVGRATRLLPFLPGSKAYQAVIRFGVTTATDDLEGDQLTRQAVPTLTQTAAIAPLPQFLGPLCQVPPRYSAVQVQGKRLYDLARQGQTVDIPTRTVTVEAITVQGWQAGDFPELTVDIRCGAGTYIRSIARDWGAQLGTGATLAALIRTHSSGFDLADSITLETLEAAIAADTFQLQPPTAPLQHLPQVHLEAALALRWRQGQKPDLTPAEMAVAWRSPIPCRPEAIATVFDGEQHFLGITTLTPGDTADHWRLLPKMVFRPAG